MNLDRGLLALLLMGEKVYAVVNADVENKQRHHGQRIENLVAAHQIIEDIIGGAVACHQEHVIVTQQHIGDVGGNAEEQQNTEGDADILALHAGHAADEDVQGGKAGDGVGQAGNHIVKGKYGVVIVVLTGTVSAQHSAQNAEDGYKVQCGFFHTTLAESGQGNDDQLDAAQEQGQFVQPVPRVFVAEAHQYDLEKLQTIDKKG